MREKNNKVYFKKVMALILAVNLVLGGIYITPQRTNAATKKYIKKLSVSESKIELEKGEKTYIKYNVKATKGTSTRVTIKVSDKNVVAAKISGKKILIKAKNTGSSVITIVTKARNKNKKKVSKKIYVEVDNEDYENEDEEVDDKDNSAVKKDIVTPKNEEIIEKKDEYISEDKNITTENKEENIQEKEDITTENKEENIQEKEDITTENKGENIPDKEEVTTEQNDDDWGEEKHPDSEESTLKISDESLPNDLIEEGTSWSCKGIITSNYEIIKVTGSIIGLKQHSNMIVNFVDVYSKTVTPNSKSYSLEDSEIDRALLFENIQIKKYYSSSFTYRIIAEDSSGKKLTLISKGFKLVPENESTLSFNNVTAPANYEKGKAWVCTGKITSNYNITEVNGYIYKSDQTTLVEESWWNRPNAKEYVIGGSDVNSDLHFDKLDVGIYYYEITARDEIGTSISTGKLKFQVVQPAPASTLKISGEIKPSSIVQGNYFDCKGEVSSNYKITEVTGSILKSDQSTVVYTGSATPNATSYSIRSGAIDMALQFNKLSVGTYYYKLVATDSSGKALTLVNCQFTVKANTTPEPTTDLIKYDSTYNIIKNASKYTGSDYDQLKSSDTKIMCCAFSASIYWSIRNDKKLLYSNYVRNGQQYTDTNNDITSGIWKKAYDLLQEGKPSILHFVDSGNGGGTHWVTIVGLKNGADYNNLSASSFICIDPAGGNIKSVQAAFNQQKTYGNTEKVTYWKGNPIAKNLRWK